MLDMRCASNSTRGRVALAVPLRVRLSGTRKTGLPPGLPRHRRCERRTKLCATHSTPAPGGSGVGGGSVYALAVVEVHRERPRVGALAMAFSHHSQPASCPRRGDAA